MTSFSQIARDEIRFDCRFYTGYKPCGKNDGCPDCPHYQPRGGQILIIKLGAMGDVLRTKAILPGLKRQHPNSWIVWLTAPGSECLARDPLVDEVLTLTTEGLLCLEGRSFERLICLDKDRHAVALAARIPADVKQGFAPTEFNTITVWNEAAMYALQLGLSDPLKFFENKKSMPQIVAEACEIPYAGESYTLSIGEAARREAAMRWSRLNIPAGRRIVGLNTGCGPVFATKGWTRERMAELVSLVARREDVALVLYGGPRERELHQHLLDAAGVHAGISVFDSGCDNPLEVFLGLLDHCEVLLTADTLAMHAGIALGKQVIAWFGSTCEQEVELFGRGEKIVTDFPCSPCYLKECPKPVFCMDAMRAATVLGAMDRALARLG